MRPASVHLTQIRDRPSSSGPIPSSAKMVKFLLLLACAVRPMDCAPSAVNFQTVDVILPQEQRDEGAAASLASSSVVERSSPESLPESLPSPLRRPADCGSLRELSHCVCRDTTSRISLTCSGIADMEMLQTVLQGHTHFSDLWLLVNGSNFPTLVQRIIGGIKVKGLQINFSNVSQVSDNAFGGMEHLKSLGIQDNQLTTVPVQAIRRLLGLEMLSFTGNHIAAIPAAAFAGLPRLQYISLTHNSISVMQKGSFGKGLQQLSLSNNSLMTLNGTVQNLTQLEWLLLTGNQLISVENELLNLPSLINLHLGNNRLRQLKTAFNSLQSLRALNLSVNEIERINVSAFAGLTALEQLDLSYNSVSNISDDAFRDLGALEFLDLTGNRLASAKGFLLPLQKLQTLELSGNLLEAFDAEDAAALSSLLYLDVSNNRLFKFGNSAAAAGSYAVPHPSLAQHLISLEYLFLSGNQLKMSDELHHLQSLTYLYLDGNGLTQLSDNFVDLPRLQVLNLSNNKIEAVTETSLRELHFLTDLDLSHNNLSRLQSDTLDHLVNLQVLNVSHNRLAYVEQDVFDNLHYLSELDLSHNSIGAIKTLTFNNLYKLLVLNLADNRLNSIKTFLAPLQTLQTLNLSGNSLSNLDGEDLVTLTALRYLILSRNNMTSIGFSSQLSLPSLLSLSLDNNQLISLHTALYHLPNLRELDVRNNSLSRLLEDTFSHNPKLRTLQIQGNQWVCDVHLTEVLLQLEGNSTQIDDKPWCINSVVQMEGV